MESCRTSGSKEKNEELVSSSLEKRRKGKTHVTGQFFLSLLLMWLASLIWEIYHGRSDLWTVIVGALFFEGTNRSLSIVISVRPKLLPGISGSSHALFINTAVSLLHSTLTSLTAVIIVTNNWYNKHDLSMFTHEQLFSGVWKGAFDLLCFSCGYFAYDQWDMLRNALYNPLAPSLLTHHMVLLVCFTSAIYRGVCVNYLILTLICEIHSIFLHWRRVSRMSGFRNVKSKLVMLEWIFNWMTFFLTRILLHMLIFVRLILDASKFPNGIELPLGLMGMFLLNVLNFILGYDILNAFVKEQRKHA
ncbi:hypothetical protein O6H91_14G037000 [Diphasiastrum complanatum]|uniref:Uncharacterized protein n=1 Tax=Diphasiastrum complanatum TaxID=34168 RepID=A0ACC2BN87_DIPCM|nr:hypothetical protein O6H91_14G037000 [Diphasiastrum complanatum]